MKKNNAYDISDQVRNNIIVDIDNGMKWKEIAAKHEVMYNVVQSVAMAERNRIRGIEAREGGVIHYWGRTRITDGKPSPVTTYKLSDLQNKGEIIQ